MAETRRRSNVSRARYRHIVGEGAAGRRRVSASSPKLRPRSASRALTRCGASRTRRTGSRASRRRSRRSAAMRPAEFAALAGVGLSGQMHGATLLDADDRPLRPAILWNDGRSFAECAELKRRVPDLEKRTGNLVMPGFTAPKMLWVAAHEPEIAKATRRVLLPKDYVRLRLSGEAVSEMSDASGTLWLDVGRRRWDEDLLAATGPSAESHAEPGRGLGGLGASVAGDRRGLGPRRAQDSDRGRRRRQRGLGHRRRRDRAGRGLRLARHLGRRLLRHRPLRQPARAHAARLLPRAAQPLARHVGDAVGRRVAVVDRRRPRTRARHRRARRGGRSLRPLEERASPPRRSSCPISAASARRTTTPRRPGMFAGLRAEHGADALVFAVMEGVAFSFADGGRRARRRRRAAGPAAPRRRRRALGILGADDRRRDRPDDRSRAGRGSGRGARRGPARHARRRRGKRRGGLRASADPARLRARSRARRRARAAPQALSRALQGREGGAALNDAPFDDEVADRGHQDLHADRTSAGRPSAARPPDARSRR